MVFVDSTVAYFDFCEVGELHTTIKMGGGFHGGVGGGGWIYPYSMDDNKNIEMNQCVEEVKAHYGEAEGERRVRTVGLATSSSNLAAKYV